MITAPGIYSMPMKEYLADPVETPSLTASILNELLQKSPAHARMRSPRLYAGYVPEDSATFDMGKAAHKLLLERTDDGIVWIPHNDFRTKAAQESRDEARAKGQMPILSKNEGTLREMVKRGREAIAQSEFSDLWDRGSVEQTVVASDCEYLMRCRPDWWSEDRKLIIDVKSTESAEPSFAIRQVGRLGYDVSAAYYLRLCEGYGAENYVWMFIETEPPFSVSFVALGNAFKAIADEKVDRGIATWKQCLSTDKWPAYPLNVHYAEPTAWMLADFESRMNREA